MTRHAADELPVPASRPRTHRRRTLAPLLLAVAVVTGAVLVGATPAGAANPSISVSPSTGLRAGQTVTVTGSGFGRSTQVYIVECVAGASSENQCSFDFSDLSTVVVAKSDASGHVRSPSPVLKTTFKGIDCTKVRCEIAAHQTISFSLTAANTATHAISFGAGSGHPSTAHGSSSHAASSSPAARTSAGSTGALSSAVSSRSAGTSAATTDSSSGTHISASALGSSGAAATSGGGSSSAAAQSPSGTARQVSAKKADNTGRYALVAVVGVLGVLFVGAMAASGRRRRPGA